MITGTSGVSGLTGGNCTREEYAAYVAHEAALRAQGWRPWYEQPGSPTTTHEGADTMSADYDLNTIDAKFDHMYEMLLESLAITLLLREHGRSELTIQHVSMLDELVDLLKAAQGLNDAIVSDRKAQS